MRFHNSDRFSNSSLSKVCPMASVGLCTGERVLVCTVDGCFSHKCPQLIKWTSQAWWIHLAVADVKRPTHNKHSELTVIIQEFTSS